MVFRGRPPRSARGLQQSTLEKAFSGVESLPEGGRPEARRARSPTDTLERASSLLALVQPVFATPSCCRPLRRPRRRCCVRSLGRALPHGSAPSPARPAQQCRQTACLSLCGGGCACHCPSHGPGCGAAVDVYGDHYAACPRTGLLARRAKPLERAWIRVVREAVGPEGQVVPQQWLVRTPAPGVDPDDRLRRIWCHAARRSTVLRRDPGLASDTRWPPATLLNHQGRCRPGRRRTPQARCLPRAPSARTATAVRARVRGRLVAQLVRSRALRAPCSAPRSCHPGLVP